MFKSKHFHRTYFVPGIVLSTLHLSTRFIFTPTIQEVYTIIASLLQMRVLRLREFQSIGPRLHSKLDLELESECTG